jgi:hypothetical protein
VFAVGVTTGERAGGAVVGHYWLGPSRFQCHHRLAGSCARHCICGGGERAVASRGHSVVACLQLQQVRPPVVQVIEEAFLMQKPQEHRTCKSNWRNISFTGQWS